MNKNPKESELQSEIIKRLNKHGWGVIKLIQTNFNGVPDLLCLRKGICMFLEVKTSAGVVSELQKHRIEQINAYGVFAAVVRSIEDVDVFCHKFQ